MDDENHESKLPLNNFVSRPSFRNCDQTPNLNESVDLADIIADLDRFQFSLSKPQQTEDTSSEFLAKNVPANVKRNQKSFKHETETFQKRLTNKQEYIPVEVTMMKCMIPIFARNDEKIGELEANETMNVYEACRRLEMMSGLEYDMNYVIIEKLLDLGIERILDDHCIISSVFERWAGNSKNTFIFINLSQKYDFFQNTANYFPAHMLDSETFDRAVTEKAAKKKRTLLEKLFSSCSNVPALEGYLYTKEFSKKSWTKRLFVLRGSGLYFTTKKKQKVARASFELKCSINFDDSELYTCFLDSKIFMKKHKSPTEHCFCLVPRSARELNEIKCFCSEDTKTMNSWITGIRIAKHGCKLRENYDKALTRQTKLAKLLMKSPVDTKENGEKKSTENTRL